MRQNYTIVKTACGSGLKEEVSIYIGEFHASNIPTIIDTILGSCVAVCLFDQKAKIGGMNHILLPGKADMKRYDAPARYGVNAMELLINEIMKAGGDRKKFVAKIFGGANLLKLASSKINVGEKNINFVLEFLEKENIKLLSKDVGGFLSRKIFFHTDTGDVYLKRIKPINYLNYSNMFKVNEEKALLKAKQDIQAKSNITFF